MSQPHISYSFSSEIEPATSDPERKLTFKIKRINTNQTEIDFSIKFFVTDNGHLSDETAELIEHMLSYHDIYFPKSGEIVEYASHKFSSAISSMAAFAGIRTYVYYHFQVIL